MSSDNKTIYQPSNYGTVVLEDIESIDKPSFFRRLFCCFNKRENKVYMYDDMMYGGTYIEGNGLCSNVVQCDEILTIDKKIQKDKLINKLLIKYDKLKKQYIECRDEFIKTNNLTLLDSELYGGTERYYFDSINNIIYEITTKNYDVEFGKTDLERKSFNVLIHMDNNIKYIDITLKKRTLPIDQDNALIRHLIKKNSNLLTDVNKKQ